MIGAALLTLLVVGAPGCVRQPEAVDLLLHGGNVLTQSETAPQASALAVRGDRIVAVGGEELLTRYRATRTLDLAGRSVLPGFIDSHTHISGRPPHHIDLAGIGSIAELQARVTARAAELPTGAWITGYGWSEDELAEGRRPLRADLDAAAPDNPVVLTRAGGHSAVASTRALALADIDADTPEPEGGVIEREADGTPNGIIRERQDLVTRLVPDTPPAALRDSLIAALRDQFRHGITSLVQASDRIDYFPEWQAAYAEHAGTLPRASVQLAWEGPEAMAAFGRVSGDGDEHLRVGAIKVFVDGGFTGPAAYTREPYKGQPDYRGKLNLSEAELRRVIDEAHGAGWQLGIHAIGDAAIELTVAALVDTLQRRPRADHRHYLNHFTVMPGAETLSAMAEHGIAITQQPNFTFTLEGRYVDNLDGHRLETNNPLRTPLRYGIHLALSSDILPIGPLLGLEAAVSRRGMSGRVFGADERLTMAEALAGYTIRGAWLTREEHLKGSLEPGKLADFVLLAKDPLTTAPDAVADIDVLATYLGGREVYRAEP
ncbi:MAG: amidohydrolase [Pseudomonadales bacterium]